MVFAHYTRKMAPFGVFACLLLQTQAFTTTGPARWGLSSVLRSSETDDASEDFFDAAGDTVVDAAEDTMDSFKGMLEREKLKRSLLQLGASYDRGFGASPRARREANAAISSLELFNKEEWAARGISGNETSPLEGSWRMIWTDAQDVLGLSLNPVASIGAIYQVFSPPVVTNIIDFIPRAQALLPPSLVKPTLFRAEVATRASVRINRPNRIGLDFEKVKVKVVEVLGFEVEDNIPSLGFDLPRINLAGSNPDAPGYFDVTYLDDEMLVIRQNAGLGLFVLIKVLENDP
jgi:hypothetical protein